MDLTTRCPQCGTTFSVSLEQLQLRKGYIRCINCANIFDGFDAVVPVTDTSPSPRVAGASQSAASQPSVGAPAASQPSVGAPAGSQPPATLPASSPSLATERPVNPPVSSQPAFGQPASSPPPARQSESSQLPSPEPAMQPANPASAMPSVLRQRPSSRRAPAHTLTMPPQPPPGKRPPAFTISSDPTRVGTQDQGPVFRVGDAVHIRADPPLGDVAPGRDTREPSMPALPSVPKMRDVAEPRVSSAPLSRDWAEPRIPPMSTGCDPAEPHIPLIPARRNAAARVFMEPSMGAKAPQHEPAATAASRPQRPTASIYVEPRRDAAESESWPGGTDFTGPERPAYYGIVRAIWAVLIIGGLVLLLAQLLYVYRAQIANTVPVLRPMLEKACEPLQCKVPYTRRIDLISIMSSSLRAGPTAGKAEDAAPDSMVLQLTMRNQHDKPQEWPTLVLDLTDFSGTLVVRKNLPPQLYLPSEALQHPFAPASEMTVSVPIAMNGLKINGYQLSKFFQ